ncbi:hypothetical protein M2132_001863 [Dysgonomonas sp. PH5-45]|uniref:DUF6340 family protein n=1 Tax=unclassified Dysgonomonas TaxID=2630389 RepID=UPI0024761AA0|nr:MULTISPECIES: DUF6340 family protein [unclassified Dysgonomonas]MDH6355518.1 hypothetical protein [Dysgonomonas sp. PH5-45]MDH6388421.1 hypothetical protein [Dysgonomonas sp. PH5-37]
MRIKTNLLGVFFCLLLATSCTTMNYIDIDVRKPAEITIPTSAENIALIDITRAEGVAGMSTVMCDALSQFLGEAQKFNSVVVFKDTLSMGKETYPTQYEIAGICNETASDALFVLNRYNLEVKETSAADMRFFGLNRNTLTLTVDALLSVFHKDGNMIVNPIQVSDSLRWIEFRRDNNNDVLGDSLPLLDEAKTEMAVYMATQMEKKLVPYWQQQERWYYSDGTTQMKRAKAFVEGDEWQEALSVWAEIYSKEKKEYKKARLASNMALAYEMLDDLEQARYWANIAAELFPVQPRLSEYEVLDKERAEAYTKRLEFRIKESDILDRQENR